MAEGREMKRVVIESPYAGDVERNTRYARACMLDSLRRGEAPYASHLLYTQVLDDLTPEERELGIIAGFAWGQAAELRVFYMDLGASPGMRRGMDEADKMGQPYETRFLVGEWAT